MNFIEDSRGLPMEDYGRPFPLSQDAEASVAAGNSLVAGEGLNVLRAQAVIYSLLNQRCQLIKQSVKEWSSFAAHYDLRGNMQERAENNMTSLQKEHGFTGDGLKAVVLSHYTGPAAPDFKALLRSLNEAIKKSSDHLQKLRRQPPDWMEEIHAGREHIWGCIPNAKHDPLSADGTSGGTRPRGRRRSATMSCSAGRRSSAWPIGRRRCRQTSTCRSTPSRSCTGRSGWWPRTCRWTTWAWATSPTSWPRTPRPARPPTTTCAAACRRTSRAC